MRAAIAFLSSIHFSDSAFSELKQPNILTIVIDDLNDWVGIFGGAPQLK